MGFRYSMKGPLRLFFMRSVQLVIQDEKPLHPYKEIRNANMNSCHVSEANRTVPNPDVRIAICGKRLGLSYAPSTITSIRVPAPSYRLTVNANLYLDVLCLRTSVPQFRQSDD